MHVRIRHERFQQALDAGPEGHEAQRGPAWRNWMVAITLTCSSLLSGCTDPSVERGHRATAFIAKISDGSFKGVPEYWSRSATCEKIAIVDTKNGETIGTLSFDPSKEIWIVSTPTTHRELMKALVTQLNRQQ